MTPVILRIRISIRKEQRRQLPHGAIELRAAAAAADEFEAAQQSRQLFVVEFHARLATGRHFKDAALKSLEVGITVPPFRSG